MIITSNNWNVPESFSHKGETPSVASAKGVSRHRDPGTAAEMAGMEQAPRSQALPSGPDSGPFWAAPVTDGVSRGPSVPPCVASPKFSPPGGSYSRSALWPVALLPRDTRVKPDHKRGGEVKQNLVEILK